MLKALLRVRLLALGSWLTGSTRKRKAQSKLQLVGFAALMLYAFGCLGFLFWHLFDTIAGPFHGAGLDWLYFAMMFIMAFALMFVGSVFTAKAQLFEAKDNDLLLSLPLKPGDILLSRMFMLMIIALAFGLLISVPAGVVWGLAVGFTGGQLAAYIIAFILLVLLTLSICALFGWLLSLLTARVQKKSLVTTVLSLVFLGGYMYVCFNMNPLITKLAAEPDAAAAAVGAVAPVYKLSQFVAEGNMTGMLAAAAIVAAIYIGTYLLLSASFLTAAAGHRGGKKVKYVERRLKSASPEKALFGRELGRFLSCSAYIMNCGLGAIMTVAGAVILLVKKSAVTQLTGQIPELEAMLPALAVLAMCLMSSMTLITAPSVSMEGRSIWIAQSLPVDMRAVLKAKLRLHYLFSLLPLLFAEAAVAAVIGARGLLLAALLLIPCIFAVFIGLLGLMENLRHPNLDWVNETQAVKSGIGLMITMFGAWAVVAVPVVLYLVFYGRINATALIFGFGAVLAAVCVLIYRWLMTKGTKLYMEL